MTHDLAKFTLMGTLLCVSCAALPQVPPREALALPTPPQMHSARYAIENSATRLIFGSCYVPQFEQSHVWTAIRKKDPDALILLGDNVYQSEENGRPELLELREAYRQLAADAAFAELRKETPVWVTWDDHDYGLNDAGAEFPSKYESEALFEHVWAIPDDDPRRLQDGVYFAKTVGAQGERTQVLVLDTRFFRTEDNMLGAEQWIWLERELQKPADLRIVASSIPVLSNSSEGENWSTWPEDRTRLLTKLTQSGNAVIISGDSHFGAFYEFAGEDGGSIIEVTSSSLNFPISESGQSPPGPLDSARRGAVEYRENFGAVEIDWPNRTVHIALYDSNGIELRRTRITLEPR